MPSTVSNSTTSSSHSKPAFILVKPHFPFSNQSYIANVNYQLRTTESNSPLQQVLYAFSAPCSATRRRVRLHSTTLPSRIVVSARGSETDNGKVRHGASSRTSQLNRFLVSRGVTLSFIVTCSVLYLVAICFIAMALARLATNGHQRIVLLASGVLLPDFRHVLKSYSQAVQELQRYKPAFQVFRFKGKAAKDAQYVKEVDELTAPSPQLFRWQKYPELVWLSGAVRQLREKIGARRSKFDRLIADLSRDMTKPIVETRTQLQYLTTGTDLTLRKNVITAAASVFLSLAGYFVSAAGEPNIGGVAIMLASLLPNAVLAPRKHEMLTLIQDIRIAISLLGTLACVVSVFFPVCAAYCFLLCCVALVVTRLPVDWMLNW